jgi:hypothetical protein
VTPHANRQTRFQGGTQRERLDATNEHDNTTTDSARADSARADSARADSARADSARADSSGAGQRTDRSNA